MSHRRLLLGLAIIGLVVALGACGDDGDDGAGEIPPGETAAPTKASGRMILATTTSTQDSGLLDVLIPIFEEESGYTVTVVAAGSGQAIQQASRGDADLVLAHSPAAEREMVENGDGIERTLVMHNDFILVGPAEDPAGIASAAAVSDALAAIAEKQSRFISRGDDSGTHALELRLWDAAGLDPSDESWYEETGQGMGATLQVANQKRGYTLSDRATYLSQRENLDLEILVEGHEDLLNYYHVIVVNPEKHPDVQFEAAQSFAGFLVRDDVQQLIGTFGVDEFGEPLFYPDAGKEGRTSIFRRFRELTWT